MTIRPATPANAATLVTEDTVDIGGALLPDLALGWPLIAPAFTQTEHIETSPS